MMNPPNDLLTPSQRSRLAIESDLSILEAEIIARLLRGDEIKEIARDLGGSERTVREHKERAQRTLGVRRLASLVRAVLRRSPWVDEVIERASRRDDGSPAVVPALRAAARPLPRHRLVRNLSVVTNDVVKNADTTFTPPPW